MDNPVIILGAGNLGEVALDIFTSNGVIVYCFLDEDEEKHGQEIDEISILGDVFDDGFLKMIGKKCNAFVAVDEMSLKSSLFDNLKDRRKVMPVNAIHASSIISDKATLGHGNMVEQGASIGTKVDMANGCHIGSNAVIGSHAKLGDYVHVGAGSQIGSGVTIENNVFIGAGATIVSGVKIGENARIGAGSVVIADVLNNATLFGNPAKAVD